MPKTKDGKSCGKRSVLMVGIPALSTRVLPDYFTKCLYSSCTQVSDHTCPAFTDALSRVNQDKIWGSLKKPFTKFNFIKTYF